MNPRLSFAKNLYDLLSSMRFAVSLLSILGVASVVGTVLKQNEPYENYIIKFGQFWFALFEQLGLYDVYHSSWFLAILLFLVVSTSLCVYRNSPHMMIEGQRPETLYSLDHPKPLKWAGDAIEWHRRLANRLGKL